MEIRKSTINDLDILMDIFDGARRFMTAHGNAAQWGDGYPTRAMIEEDIALGRSYVVTDGGAPLATFMLLETPEPTYAVIDGAWLDDRPYATLHRIASSGATRGTVDIIVAWAFERAGNLRGDTHRLNLPMQRAFERNGFVRCGIVWMKDGTQRVAYHKIS